MNKRISLIVLLAMLIGVFATPISVFAADIKAPSDVAKVLIYTDGGVDIPSNKSKVGCEIYIIDEEGGQYETVHASGATVNVRGNSTSSAYKKPYNIKFESKTDVLGMGKNKKWSLLANCYDKTLMRNAVVMDFAKELGVPYTPDYRFVDVYVNDKLQGSYVIIDSVEVGETRVDIDLDNNEYLIELDWNPEDADCYYFYSWNGSIKFAINEPEIDELSDTQKKYVTDLIANAEAALKSGSYSEVVKYFDIESMAQFYLTLEFFRNIDVVTSSTRFHIKNGKIYGGPVWDFDLSSGNYNVDYYGQGTTKQAFHATNMKWFRELVKYEDFQNEVNKDFLRMQDTIVNLYSDNTLGLNKIDTILEKYGASFERNNTDAGWAPNVVHHASMQLERHPDATYEANLEFYRNWLKERNEWLLGEWGLTSFIELDSGADVTLDGYYINGTTNKTTAKELASQFKTAGVSVINGTALTDDDIVPNGSIVTAGGVSYAVVLKGDVYADGVINEYDYMMIMRDYFDTIELNEVQTRSADVNGDGIIDQYDYVLVARHYFNTFDIYS